MTGLPCSCVALERFLSCEYPQRDRYPLESMRTCHVNMSSTCHPREVIVAHTSISFSFAIFLDVFSLPFLKHQSTSHLSNLVSAHLVNSGPLVVGRVSIMARWCKRSRITSCVGFPAVSCRSESWNVAASDTKDKNLNVITHLALEILHSSDHAVNRFQHFLLVYISNCSAVGQFDRSIVNRAKFTLDVLLWCSEDFTVVFIWYLDLYVT